MHTGSLSSLSSDVSEMKMATSMVVLILGSLSFQPVSTWARDGKFYATEFECKEYCSLDERPYQEQERDVLGLHHITYDTADLIIENILDVGINVWIQSEECHQCKLLKIADVDGNRNQTLKVDTAWATRWEVTTRRNVSCHDTYHFGENGSYTLSVQYNSSDRSIMNCKLGTDQPPQDSKLPIYVAIAVYAGIAVFYIILLQLNRAGLFSKLLYCLSVDRLVDSDLGTPTLNPTEITINNTNGQKKSRLRSLDTFRGIAICVMIFVNYGGGQYWFFRHSKWNGLTLADLAFPWFVFIMGASIKLSQASLYRRGLRRRKIFLKIVMRTVILFALGLLLDAGNELKYYRVPGVLQRLAAAYFFAASLQLLSLSPPREERLQRKFYRLFADILDYWHEWVIMILAMIGYCCTSYLATVDGCPKGYIGPGGTRLEDPTLVNCTGGIAGAIDRWLFSPNHIYRHPTCTVLYGTVTPYDPEGALGVITTIFLTFLGIQASKIIHTYHDHSSRLIRLFTWGIITGGIATFLCEASKNDGWVPINKNLWSPSFVLATAGLAFILLAICYYFIDVNNWWSGVPFYQAGMNSILIYVGHEIVVSFAFPFSWKPVHGAHAEYLGMNLVGVTLWVVIATWLHYIEFYLKI